MDSVANGRIKVTISNWIGVAYKIPRESLSTCKERNDLSQSSVYFLFGFSDEMAKPVAYIGQAGVRKNGGGILTRLLEHDKNPDKDFWSEAVVFTTSNNSFGPTELSYLENRFCNRAIAAKRYEVKNANDPTPGNITEEKESELEEYAEYAELILGVLGYKVFEPVKAIVKKAQHKKRKEDATIPDLPSHDMKIGEYVRTAMRNLSNSGYVFLDSDIELMCTKEWSKAHFHTEHCFMRKYIPGNTTNKEGQYVRYWSEPFNFGDSQVLISKEWYPRHFELFDEWYKKL